MLSERRRAWEGWGEVGRTAGKVGFKGKSKASIANKLAQGSLWHDALFAYLATLELDGMKLEDL